MDNFSVPSGSLPPIPPTAGNNNMPVAPSIIQQAPSPVVPSQTPASTTTTTTTPAAASTASSAPPVPVTKVLLAVIPFFAFVVTGAISYRLLNQPQPTRYLSRASAQPSPTVNLPNIDIAKNAITWVNQQKDNNGIYYFVINKKSSGEQLTPVTDGRVGVLAAWAKWSYWKKTNNSIVLATVLTDLDNHLDKTKLALYQPDFWGCRVLYKMASDKQSSPEIQQKAKQLCDRATYPPISNVPDDQVNPLISEYTSKYMWEKAEQDLTNATTLFAKAKTAYQTQKAQNLNYVSGECILGTASLDLYRATNNQEYLTFAKSLADSDDLTKAFSAFSKTNCGLFLNDLFITTNNQTYKTQGQQIIKSLVANNLDGTTFAFYDKTADGVLMDVRASALAIKLLSE